MAVLTSRASLTEQQSAAIHTTDVSIALSAGAGCGKTFVLTQRFLASLQPRSRARSKTDLQSLVAITFTDRAAREMRDRIRQACDERLHNCPIDDVDRWMEIQRGLDSARISTIHSFCAGVLRSQAVEAGLDPRFVVLERPLADTLLRHVVRDQFHALVESADSDASYFVVRLGFEQSKALLFQLVRQQFQFDFSRFANTTPAEFTVDWLERWNNKFVPKLIEEFRQSSIVQRALEATKDSPSSNETIIERIANLHALLDSSSHWDNPIQTLETIHENARIVAVGGKKAWVSEVRQKEVKTAFEKLRESARQLKDNLSCHPSDVDTAAELACRALRLTQRISDEYAKAKREQGALDFDDLVVQARNLLRDNQSVRRQVAAGIQLLMVDEFQDTDPVQAELVRSLCGTALKRGKLFMVGDRKQSIYRFRRADPTVFVTMSAELPEAGRLPLNVNFRSQPAVLDFVNHLFANAMNGYEKLVPFQQTQSSPTPAIEFLFATADAKETTQADPEQLFEASESDDEDETPGAQKRRKLEAKWIASRIRALISDPTPRIRDKKRDAGGQPKLRPVKLSDIVILFRALSNVQIYESALTEQGLPYYLVRGKAFFTQQEVFDLLNLCRYLDDCDDLIGLVGVLRSPFFNLSDDALQALSIDAHSLHEALYLPPPSFLPDEQQHRIRFAAEVLTELRTNKDRIPLSDLLNRAIERTGYDASLLCEFLGPRKLANLRKLVEMARQFDVNETATLKDFVTRLQTSVLEETEEEFATTLEESDNVVRLMSIHQSKGLEFPVVVVADVNRKGPPRGRDAVLHPELGPLIKLPNQFGSKADNIALRMHNLAEAEADAEETIRLFYVACTRAADYLILSTGLDSNIEFRSPWMELIESRFDVQTGLPKVDPLLGSSCGGTAGRESIPDIYIHHEPCAVQAIEHSNPNHVPVGRIWESVRDAQPAELPASLRVFARDATDPGVISVSRLESVDAELSGIQHIKGFPRTDSDVEDAIDPDMATTLGTIVHAVLEAVDFRNPVGWQDLLLRLSSLGNDEPDDALIDQARPMLERFFTSPIAGELAVAKTMHREIDFLLPWRSEQPRSREGIRTPRGPAPMIAGIIDLLIETDRGWHVLDYKTGEFPQHASDAQLLAPYELQLAIYAHAVERWFGAAPRELSLIAFKPTVRRITLAWSAERWNRIQARIDRAMEALRRA